MNRCRIYEEDSRAHYKIMNNERRKNQDCGKPYNSPTDKGKQKVFDGKKTSGGGASAPAKCFRYGEQGQCPMNMRINYIDFTNVVRWVIMLLSARMMVQLVLIVENRDISVPSARSQRRMLLLPRLTVECLL